VLMSLPSLGRCEGLFLLPPLFIRIFFDKPDRAGRAKFAIEFGIPAFETFVAHVNLIFHAHKFGFPIRMIDTFAHGFVPFVLNVL
jgi:hypothetical protein